MCWWLWSVAVWGEGSTDDSVLQQNPGNLINIFTTLKYEENISR
jgi:hypothetical protein